MKASIAFMIIFSIAIPQNIHANPGADGSEQQKNQKLSAERIDFNQALPPATVANLGINPGSVFTVNSTAQVNGQKINVDVLQAEFSVDEVKKMVRLLKQLEPRVKKSMELSPGKKFQINHITSSNDTHNFEIMEALKFFGELDRDSEFYRKFVHLSVYERITDYFSTLFGKKTKRDYYLTVARFVGGGGSATYSMWVSGIPMPISAIVGITAIGGGSASVGFLIDEYTGWLDNNVVDPKKQVRDRLVSIETLMMLSPLLIHLQETGVFTYDGGVYMAATLGITALIQNGYYEIKKRSPRAAMWYKWKATEVLFLTSSTVMLPIWDIFAVSAMDAILSTFMFAGLSTISQGVWDIFLTSARRPFLEKAQQIDQMEFEERTKGIDLGAMGPGEVYKLLHREEIKVRDKFKIPFYVASFFSVLFSVGGTTGRNTNTAWLVTAGFAGLLALGTVGGVTWFFYNRRVKALEAKATERAANDAHLQFMRIQERVSAQKMTCSALFGM